MRVAILGAGGLGRTLASELRTDPRVSSLLVVDKIGDRARVLSGVGGRVPIEAHALNVENVDMLARALRGSDVAVNAILPKYNLTIMRACLEAGVGYLDVSAAGPSRPGGPLGIYEQLDLHETFRSAGVTALVSMGMDPGISNVIAKDAAAPFDAIDAIRIRTGSVIQTPGLQSFPLYSREAFLEDMLVRPTIWLNGKLEERDPLGEEEDFSFPPPVGPRRVYLVSHEEIKTIPRFLGKPVGRVDYKFILDPNLVRALLALNRLGLLDEGRLVRLGSQLVPFRRALLSVFPEPSAHLLPIDGMEALTVEVEGQRGGSRVVRRGDVLLAQQEANRRRNTNAVNYLTAVGMAIGINVLAEKALPGPGVFSSDVLEPARVWREWKARELPLAWSERALAA
jgi:saccharopine dehydrogenase (NAD+, L-lysine-forming)